MTPADGGSLHLPLEAAARGAVEVPVAVVLPGGRCLLAVEGAGEPPPGAGEAALDRPAVWAAACWPLAGEGSRWAGLAVLDAVPARACELRGPGGRWALAAPARLDVSPEPLAAFARARGLPGRGLLDLLAAHLPPGAAGPEERRRRDFVAGFLLAAAEPDGFVEILGAPECGGLVAQGWSVSLDAGSVGLARPDGGRDGDEGLATGEAATFARDDILPPGRGVCIFGHDWTADLGALGAVVFEQGGPLRRLDVVEAAVLRLEGADATRHVAHMLPRLAGPTGTLRAFRRVCRPRYPGHDTLSGTALPVAAALDAVFQAPDGGLLAMGWLLDPLHRVERVHVKSTAHLYAPLQDRWHRLPRPDLAAGFATDPRFARLLDSGDALHGFLAYAPGRLDQVAGAEAYLELVLDDGSCLFRPLAVTPLADRDRVPSLLGAVPPDDPDVDAVVRDTLAPFLRALPPRPPRPRGGPRPILLGAPGAGRDAARDVAAVMPVRDLVALQPVMALLAGTPEADALRLVLVASRSEAAGLMPRLDDAFRFFGLQGALLLAPEREGLAGRLEAGVAASEGARVLLWTPRALPRTPGWLGALMAEADALDGPALVSPTLVYEDGSVHFGGPGQGAPGEPSLLGYPAGWLPPGGARAAATGAAEVALVDRALLARAGGLAGRTFGEALAHRDLARRLRAAGGGTFCAGSVEFWMLDDDAGAHAPREAMADRVDALLLGEDGR